MPRLYKFLISCILLLLIGFLLAQLNYIIIGVGFMFCGMLVLIVGAAIEDKI